MNFALSSRSQAHSLYRSILAWNILQQEYEIGEDQDNIIVQIIQAAEAEDSNKTNEND